GLVVAFHRLAIIGVQVSADTVSLCVVARATAWRFVFRRSMALLSTGGFFGFVFALFALTFSFSRLVLALPAFTLSLACTPLALPFGLFGFVFRLFAFAFSLLGFILSLPAFALGLACTAFPFTFSLFGLVFTLPALAFLTSTCFFCFDLGTGAPAATCNIVAE